MRVVLIVVIVACFAGTGSAQAPALAAAAFRVIGTFVRDVAVNAAGNVVGNEATRLLNKWRDAATSEPTSGTSIRQVPPPQRSGGGWQQPLSGLRPPPGYRETYAYRFQLEWSDGRTVHQGELRLEMLTRASGATGYFKIATLGVDEIINTAETTTGQLVLQGSSPTNSSGRSLPAYRPDVLLLAPTPGGDWTISEICKDGVGCSPVRVTDAWTGIVPQ
jgi:hypothetical protein